MSSESAPPIAKTSCNSVPGRDNRIVQGMFLVMGNALLESFPGHRLAEDIRKRRWPTPASQLLAASQPASEPANGQARKQASEQASKQASTPTSRQTARQPGSQPASQPANQAARRAVSKPANRQASSHRTAPGRFRSSAHSALEHPHNCTCGIAMTLDRFHEAFTNNSHVAMVWLQLRREKRTRRTGHAMLQKNC